MGLLCVEGGVKSLPNKEPVQQRGGGETEVSEASELQSPVDLACPMRQESEGFWRPVDLAHQRWESEGFWKSSRPGLSSPSDGRRVKATSKVAQPT